MPVSRQLTVAYIELAMLLRSRRERVDMRRLIALAVERGTPGLNMDERPADCLPEETNLLPAEPTLRIARSCRRRATCGPFMC